MLRASAINTLELSLALTEHNCFLQDAYPWNTMFESTKPIFVDLTSIVPIDTHLMWPAYQQFANFYLNPLELASMGKWKLARLLLMDHINGVTLDDFNKSISASFMMKHPFRTFSSMLFGNIDGKIQNNNELKIKLQQKVSARKSDGATIELRKRFLKRLLRKINNIRIKEAHSTWKNYYEDLTKSFKNNNKVVTIDRILSELKPDTVLDVGSNVGRYSIIAAKNGARVISIDSSEQCIEALYKEAETKGYKIIPLICDILNPTPAFGFISKQFPPLVKRIKSDIVLCLGLMHHLHINGRQSFDRIALLMNELSNRAVIFEYVDFTDDNINLLDHGREISYSLESVSGELSKYFKLSFFDSDRETRKIILCEK
jgi:2-polyprenyl-3-methyl-5-hydroxy-6-metoxy-1,4-benzoquinol methylase